MQPFDHVILAIPHATGVFDTSLWSDPKAVARDARRWTDWYTDELFTDSRGTDPRIRYLVGTVSRFDCDLERLENDPLEQIGQGRLYTRSHSGATRAVPEDRAGEWLDAWREWRFAARHLALDCPRPILIDCHSFPSDLAPDVDVCLGFNDDETKPADDVLAAVRDALEALDLRVAFNIPYGNALSPEGFPGPSLLVELNKRLYMNERSLAKRDGNNGGWKLAIRAIRAVCDTLLGGSLPESVRGLLPKYGPKDYIKVPGGEAHEWGEMEVEGRFGSTVTGSWWRSMLDIEVKTLHPHGRRCARYCQTPMKFHGNRNFLARNREEGIDMTEKLLKGLVSGNRDMWYRESPKTFKYSDIVW